MNHPYYRAITSYLNFLDIFGLFLTAFDDEFIVNDRDEPRAFPFGVIVTDPLRYLDRITQ